MPRDKEKQKEYMRLRYIANKEKIKEYYRLKYIANKEKIKEYYVANKEKIKEKMKAYYQTPQGKKNHSMNDWRSRGVNNVDDELYNKYINTHCCDVCSKEFKSSRDRCLDHDHETGDFRQVLCHSCNTRDNWKKKIEA